MRGSDAPALQVDKLNAPLENCCMILELLVQC